MKPGPSDKATPYDNHPANQKGESYETQALICWLRLVTERNDCDKESYTSPQDTGVFYNSL